MISKAIVKNKNHEEPWSHTFKMQKDLACLPCLLALSAYNIISILGNATV